MKHYIYSLVASVVLIFFACTPDSFDTEASGLVSDDLVEGIAFSITHDSDNPNIIYLKSLFDKSYLALWEHPQGRSEGNEVTLQMPFAGTYSVTFGIQTNDGIIYGESATFTVDDFCADFVTDDLWTYLSGGVGNSKRWVLDIDADGVSRYFNGPVYFYGTDDCWESITGGESIDGDSWSWEADYSSVAGWQFTSPLIDDFGYMEFDLIDGSNYSVVMNDLGISQTGTYMLDTDAHTLTLTDAQLLHDAYNDALVDAWSGKLTLLSLTEDAMQVGVIRTSDPCMLSFNFVSEDYYDNWVEDTGSEEVTPELSDTWMDDVTKVTTTSITWKLSADTPFDWCDLSGARKNGFSSLSDYSSWCTPADDVSDITLVLNSATNAYSLELPDGTSVSGTYSLSSDGIYTFDNGLSSYLIGSDWIYFSADYDNALRLMSYEVESSGAVSDIWLGAKQYNSNGKLYQYLAYHFEAQLGETQAASYSGSLNFFDTSWNFINSDTFYVTDEGSYTVSISGSSDAPYGIYLDIEKLLKDYPNCDIEITDIKVDGTSISFDDTAIDRGTGDESTTARRYILNPWGATANTASNYVFSSSISVTINITFDMGSPFVSE